MIPKLTALAIAVFLLAACNQTETTTTKQSGEAFNEDSARASIDAKNEQFSTAFVKGDSATIVRLYHENAKLYPPNMPMMKDRREMGSMMATVPKMGVTTGKLKSKEILGGPDYAIEMGTYDMGDNSKKIDEGKYIVIWKKENGEWKMYRDIWNSDNPPPPPVPSNQK